QLRIAKVKVERVPSHSSTLVKKCERRASPGMCACVPKEMHKAGFSYEEILMFSNPAYKAVTPAEIERNMDYGMKLKLVAVPACHNK
ncbi:hypothetical protein ACRS5L_27450, partial [Metapseudomonas otitidis]|uniref:hypothetical protein n=1 Tax=Metapseudomonas otitidis TaxID=319939 RepID=UPI003EDF5664